MQRVQYPRGSMDVRAAIEEVLSFRPQLGDELFHELCGSEHSVREEELQWMLDQRALDGTIESLRRDYGATATDIIHALERANVLHLLPSLAWHGVGSRYRHFVPWAQRLEGALKKECSESQSTSQQLHPLTAFVAYAWHLGRVVSHRALAMDCEVLPGHAACSVSSSCDGSALPSAAEIDSAREPAIVRGMRGLRSTGMQRIIDNDSIWPSGRLRTDENTLRDVILRHGSGFVCYARLYIGLRLVKYDPSLSLHDDAETALCIAEGYMRAGMAVFMFDLDVPVIESCGWSVHDVRVFGPDGPDAADDSRWFKHRGIYFDAYDQRTERYTFYEIPFVRDRCVRLRVFHDAAGIAALLKPFKARMARVRQES